MKLTFEKYEKKGRQVRGVPAVSISEKSLLFNIPAYKRYLEGFEYMELFFDKHNQVIGLKPLKQSTADSFPIKVYRPGNEIVLINCKTFITDNRLMDIIGDRKSFQVEDYEGGMLIAKLGEK